ncbi:MAG TPA: hypothetical protein VEB03_01710 [Candidatus Nanoarchaeia archaeon]|nr:hypothetical protein [Candidatus Nanoarchaeia archaeon]
MAGKLFVYCAALALCTTAFAQTAKTTEQTKGTAAREAGSGLATGKTHVHGDPHVDEKDGVKAPRDAASGQASGKRQHGVVSPRDPQTGQATGQRANNPVHESSGQSGTNPLYEGQQTREAGSGIATGKRQHKPAMSGAQSNPMYQEQSEAAVIKTKTKSNQSNDRLVNAGPKDGWPSEAGSGVSVAAGDVDGDGAADRKATKSRSNIQNNRTAAPTASGEPANLPKKAD